MTMEQVVIEINKINPKKLSKANKELLMKLKAEERLKREQEKQKEKKEKERKRAEIEKERELKRIKLEQEKEARRVSFELKKKEREEKKLQLEKEKEEKRLQLEKEKEEKRLQVEKEKKEKLKEKERIKLEKLQELQAKNEEKRKKEEERLRKIQEKKQSEEKEQRKKARSSEIFIGFFKRNSFENENLNLKNDDDNSFTLSSLFLPFQLQPNQELAEIVPKISKSQFNSEVFEQKLVEQNTELNCLYLNDLKSKKFLKIYKKKNKPVCNENEESLVILELRPKMYKVKYLHFHTDIRPPYYGTWSKKSSNISGRRPFQKDDKNLNYEVDSEEEWEEEEEGGESINDSDSDNSRNGNDDFEMDDFCVPHGHLSDSEEILSDEEKKNKHTLFKETDLMKERSKKVAKLNPIVIGCFWQNNKVNKESEIYRKLAPFRAVYNDF